MEIKKAHEGAKDFGSARKLHLSQNMQPKSKICKSTAKILMNIIFLVVIFIFSSTVSCYASSAASIDRFGNKIYYFVVAIGKWVIIVKGAFDVIQAVISGDFQAAKRLFFGYVLAFAVLYGLPWIFTEIEVMFREM